MKNFVVFLGNSFEYKRADELFKTEQKWERFNKNKKSNLIAEEQ